MILFVLFCVLESLTWYISNYDYEVQCAIEFLNKQFQLCDAYK